MIFLQNRPALVVLHHLFKCLDSAPIIQDDIPKDVTDGVTQQTSNGKK